ncbi:MAG: TolC family outer membrane protein [Gammaproteobacteria bacterium]|nr:TolC family outer membrane protein [Gammaproteobacteria bacterium]
MKISWKKKCLLIFSFCALWHAEVFAADLLDVYKQALLSDPIFQQAISQRLVTKTGVPISFAAILPNISAQFNPTVTRTGFSGSFFQVDGDTGIPLTPRNNTARAYTLALNLNQTVFDFAQFAAIAQQISFSKGADATLNAALQDLMIRVANAYFIILKDEDDLRFAGATKRAYHAQLSQVRQQYQVGLKTITEVYIAQASYDSAVANEIAIQNRLANDKENLRVITGLYYPNLAYLSEAFPLVIPFPQNMEAWVNIAECQNWNIIAAQYNVNAARTNVKQQFAGHLPTVALQATMDRFYVLNINGYNSLINRNGPGTQTDRSIGFNIQLPIFSGGLVNAQTDQAKYQFQVAQQQLEQTLRDSINQARQSYHGTISGISQIKADKQTIKSTISSLQGMEASYQVGTETLVNVLNQQEKVFQAQTEYAKDRYDFVMSILRLKQAAGTLGFNDLIAVNRWLIERGRKRKHRS